MDDVFKKDGDFFDEDSNYDQLQELIYSYVKNYYKTRDDSLNDHLITEINKNLPQKKRKEIEQIVDEIIVFNKVNDENQRSLQDATNSGLSKDNWFYMSVKQIPPAFSNKEFRIYFENIDSILCDANIALNNTITTKTGEINQNPNLNGFIAEQEHAQSFNINAALKGSKFRAKVIEPGPNGYEKNSPDLVILDKKGNIESTYQAKYYSTAEATEKAYLSGDYKGQKLLVPSEQQSNISIESHSVLQAPDGTTSNPITKAEAMEKQNKAQSGNWNERDWDFLDNKQLVYGICKQIELATLKGMIIGAGFTIAKRMYENEQIDISELVITSLRTGSDFGLKATIAAALKVAVEKGFISWIPKGTPMSTITNIVYVAIENLKIANEISDGKISLIEGIEKMQQTSLCVLFGLITMEKGSALGMSIGLIFGPIGVALGGLIGGSIGYICGSKIGHDIYEILYKLRVAAKELVMCNSKNEGEFSISTNLAIEI